MSASAVRRDPRAKKARDFRRRRFSTVEPYRRNGVILSPRRAMRGPAAEALAPKAVEWEAAA